MAELTEGRMQLLRDAARRWMLGSYVYAQADTVTHADYEALADLGMLDRRGSNDRVPGEFVFRITPAGIDAARKPPLRVKRLSPTAQIPRYQTAGAAGLDLTARTVGEWVRGGHIRRVPTGVAVEIPTGYVGLIRGRSSTAERGVFVVEGTVDPDYTGELHIQLYGQGAFSPGDRLAQLVVVASPRFEVVECEQLQETARGSAGFGSTGRR